MIGYVLLPLNEALALTATACMIHLALEWLRVGSATITVCTRTSKQHRVRVWRNSTESGYGVAPFSSGTMLHVCFRSRW